MNRLYLWRQSGAANRLRGRSKNKDGNRREAFNVPTKLKTRCRKPGCPNLTDNSRGFCDEHRGYSDRIYKASRRDTGEQSLYQSARWRKLRAQKLQENPFCEVCARGKPSRITAATITHHRVPLKRGGDPYEWSNLESI